MFTHNSLAKPTRKSEPFSDTSEPFKNEILESSVNNRLNPNAVLHLQRTIGNQRTQALVTQADTYPIVKASNHSLLQRGNGGNKGFGKEEKNKKEEEKKEEKIDFFKDLPDAIGCCIKDDCKYYVVPNGGKSGIEKNQGFTVYVVKGMETKEFASIKLAGVKCVSKRRMSEESKEESGICFEDILDESYLGAIGTLVMLYLGSIYSFVQVDNVVNPTLRKILGELNMNDWNGSFFESDGQEIATFALIYLLSNGWVINPKFS